MARNDAPPASLSSSESTLVCATARLSASSASAGRPEYPTSTRGPRRRLPSRWRLLRRAGKRHPGGEPAVKRRPPLRTLFVGSKC
jgi:hypothetical protein